MSDFIAKLQKSEVNNNLKPAIEILEDVEWNISVNSFYEMDSKIDQAIEKLQRARNYIAFFNRIREKERARREKSRAYYQKRKLRNSSNNS